MVRRGVTALKRGLPKILADDYTERSGEIRDLLGEMSEWQRTLESRSASCDEQIAGQFKDAERCRRLAKVPGVGQLAATALLAAVGQAREFRNGRELRAFLGLVPRQHSSGGKGVLLGITKRGARYLGTLLISGARASLRWCTAKTDASRRWAARIKIPRGANGAAGAMANKNARVWWAVLSPDDRYRPNDAIDRPVAPRRSRRGRESAGRKTALGSRLSRASLAEVA